MYNKLLSFIKPYFRIVFIAVFCEFILSGIMVVASDKIKTTTDTVLAGNTVKIASLLLIMLSLICLGMTASFLSTFLFEKISLFLIRDIKNTVTQKICNLPFSYFEEKGSGGIISKLTGDIKEVQSLFKSLLPDFTYNVILVLCFTSYMLYLNVVLTIVAIIVFPLSIFILNFINKRLVKLTKTWRQGFDTISQAVTDAIGGIYIEKSYNLQEHINKKLTQTVDEALLPDLKRQKLICVVGVIGQFLRWLPLFICCALGAFTTFYGQMSGGSLVSYILLLSSLTHPINELPFIFADIKQKLVSVERIYEILNISDEPTGTVTQGNIDDTTAITFKDICFEYNEGHTILKDINFTVNKGVHIALVGASGCGKSTIFKLICGFYTPNSGFYSLYGVPFTEWNIAQARKNIAIVSQDVFLFPDTIAENISYGCLSATMEDIEKAAKFAGIHDFISSLKDGYNSLVGERGIKLSGGERQRISIARAFLKNADILLLDEPTSALDMQSENIIQNALAELCNNKTVITIAHRLSTIKNADEILVIEDGHIVEKGTHEQLIKGGVYASLYSKQIIENLGSEVTVI